MAGIMNTIKEGADLTKPKASGKWMIGAVVAIALLGIAIYLYKKAKSVVSPVTTKTTNAVNTAFSGIYGNGT